MVVRRLDIKKWWISSDKMGENWKILAHFGIMLASSMDHFPWIWSITRG